MVYNNMVRVSTICNIQKIARENRVDEMTVRNEMKKAIAEGYQNPLTRPGMEPAVLSSAYADAGGTGKETDRRRSEWRIR